MYFQKRGDSFSFIFYDSHLKKNVRLSRKAHPLISSEEEAEAFCDHYHRHAETLEKKQLECLRWAELYPEFNDHVALYENARKEEAPNSFFNGVAYLKYYVLPYFLTLRSQRNIDLWHAFYEEFRDHLETVTPLHEKAEGTPLSYSTLNQVINALNTFIVTMYRRRICITKEKCRPFSHSKLNARCEESVIDETIQRVIEAALEKRDPLSSKFFHLSLHTGMRLNELLGLSLADFFLESPSASSLLKALKPYDLHPLAFIAFDSQPSLRFTLRDPFGHVPRKPLKGRKKIEAKDCRIIPLFEKKSFNLLAELWNAQRLSFQKKRYGENPKDYLLFEGLSRNRYSLDLKCAQKALRLNKLFTPHDTRHTYSTWLADQTGGSYTLCQTILGHSDLSMTMRYVHLNAKIQKQLQSSLQLEAPLTYLH